MLIKNNGFPVNLLKPCVTETGCLNDQAHLQFQVERTAGLGQFKGDRSKGRSLRRTRPAFVLARAQQRQHDGGGGPGSSQPWP